MKVNPKFVSPVLMWAIVIAGTVVSFLTLPNTPIFGAGRLSFVVLGMGITNWLYMLVMAGSVHRNAPKSASAIDKLVTEGIYAHVRHPIYSADIVLAWAIFVAWPIQSVLASVIWLTLVLLFWTALEEKALEDKFMDDYRAYRARTNRIFPRFRRTL